MVGDARNQVKTKPCREPRPLRQSRPSLIMSGMKKVLEPAVHLMNRLRYPQKFALISLLFAIPIAFMMSLWLVELHHRMAFTARERGGPRLWGAGLPRRRRPESVRGPPA